VRSKTLVAALLVSAAIAGCGSVQTDPSTTTPVTFTTTVPVPTTTVPTTTATPYLGPQGVPIETGRFLAPGVTSHLGAVVNGILCNVLPQLAYTAYAHLQVYVSGRSRALPGGIGIVGLDPVVTTSGLFYRATTCYYWIHTRAADGVIEVESPNGRRYTLADFFAIWDQPLTGDRVAGARGKVTAVVNGKLWTGTPGQIPLREHTQIELAVGKPVPHFSRIDWNGTGI